MRFAFRVTSPRLLALVPLANAAWVAYWHLRAGTPWELLWMCNVSTLLLGVGLLAARAPLVKLATVWLMVGTPMWLLELGREGDWQVHSLATHVAEPLLGLLALRHLPATNQIVWRWGIVLLLALQLVCRAVTPASANVNVSFRAWEGLAGVFPGYPVYWIAHLVFFALALFAVERLLDRAMVR